MCCAFLHKVLSFFPLYFNIYVITYQHWDNNAYGATLCHPFCHYSYFSLLKTTWFFFFFSFFLTYIKWADFSQFYHSLTPAYLVTVITKNAVMSGYDNKVVISGGGSFHVCASSAIAYVSHRDVMASTDHGGITEFTAGPVGVNHQVWA